MIRKLFFWLFFSMVGWPIHAQQRISSDSMVSMMSYQEKIAQLTGSKSRTHFIFTMVWSYLKGSNFALIKSGENRRLGIIPIAFTDGPRGVVVGQRNTCFPVALARGASFDTQLETRVAQAMALEAKSQGANYFAGICINLIRHPSGGRAQESYSEDPFLTGEMGLAITREIQRNGLMACVKHFALNNSEENRYKVNVHLSDRTLHEVYLPHFRKVVQEGKAASVMSAYNKVRGDYCGESHYLLTKILREQWGFRGFVSSDWEWGLRNGSKGIQAGLSIEMGYKSHFGKELELALERGEISIAQIDERVKQVLEVKSQYKEFKKKKLSKSQIQAHRALALESAQQSMVLLKNHQVLPFSDSVQSLLLTGSKSKSKNMGDVGSSKVKSYSHSTPFHALKAYCKSRGIRFDYSNSKNLQKLNQKASKAEAVVACVGFDHKDEGEWIMKNPDENKYYPIKFSGGDRENLRLHPDDESLVFNLSRIHKNTAIIYYGGGAPDLSHWNDSCRALLFAFYPGMEGGEALADILFGKVNPSAKLPYSIFKNATDYPPFFYQSDSAYYGYYHGYTLAQKNNIEELYPFGFGLSYTSFDIQPQTPELKNDTVQIFVSVKNSGTMAGAEVVQCYVDFSESKMERPKALLKAFEKVHLNPGETKLICLKIPISELFYYSESSQSFRLEGMQYGFSVGNSSDLKSMRAMKLGIYPGN